MLRKSAVLQERSKPGGGSAGPAGRKGEPERHSAFGASLAGPPKPAEPCGRRAACSPVPCLSSGDRSKLRSLTGVDPEQGGHKLQALHIELRGTVQAQGRGTTRPREERCMPICARAGHAVAFCWTARAADCCSWQRRLLNPPQLAVARTAAAQPLLTGPPCPCTCCARCHPAGSRWAQPAQWRN